LLCFDGSEGAIKQTLEPEKQKSNSKEAYVRQDLKVSPVRYKLQGGTNAKIGKVTMRLALLWERYTQAE
jgi:hypothetical protein